MIKYILICHNEHEFESWFSDSKEFEKLKTKKLLECIYCNSKNISKSIMSPRIAGKKIDHENLNNKYLREIQNEKKNLIKIRNYIEKNFEYVGKDFSKKVRDIFYDKKNKKTIYGTTTLKERKELAEEGIELLSVPWIDKEN